MEIQDDNGTNFENSTAQKSYIHNYFKNIYKKGQNVEEVTLEKILDFLGPVQHHPTVTNAKLSENEKNLLECDNTIDELTKSINAANMASAPGGDGISNRFIKHFWNYFSKPLLKLCKFCFYKGELPNTFLTANIKLIPKKGNVKHIKNWRPISLLNCFYKIVSRAFSTRLKKYMDKMTPICQKGYSSTRYCQEVLISVIEGIETCN